LIWKLPEDVGDCVHRGHMGGLKERPTRPGGGTFTRGTSEARSCLPQVAAEVGVPGEKLRTVSTKDTWAASKSVPLDPEGTFTRGISEARTCLPQVAVKVGVPGRGPALRAEAGEPEERLVLGAATGWESPKELLQNDYRVRQSTSLLPAGSTSSP
jgi:hypothetical protein